MAGSDNADRNTRPLTSHILWAFRKLQIGEALSVAELVALESPWYGLNHPDGRVTPSAIVARLILGEAIPGLLIDRSRHPVHVRKVSATEYVCAPITASEISNLSWD